MIQKTTTSSYSEHAAWWPVKSNLCVLIHFDSFLTYFVFFLRPLNVTLNIHGFAVNVCEINVPSIRWKSKMRFTLIQNIIIVSHAINLMFHKKVSLSFSFPFFLPSFLSLHVERCRQEQRKGWVRGRSSHLGEGMRELRGCVPCMLDLCNPPSLSTGSLGLWGHQSSMSSL